MIVVSLLRVILVTGETEVPRLAIVLLLVLAATPLAACGVVSGGNPQVLTTTTILADMAKQVAGDRTTVGSIVPAGAHVEAYEPRPEHAKRTSAAHAGITKGTATDKQG